MKNLFVGNLPFSAAEEEVKNLFAQYGVVTGIELISDRSTGQSRGFCFIRMEDADAEKAVEALNGQLFGGRRLQIKEAFPRVERPPRPDRPFRRRYDDRGDAGFDGERRPFRRRYDDHGDAGSDGERRPFRRRYDDRDGGSYDGERRPFRRRYDDRGNAGSDGERRPFRRRYDDRGNAGFDGKRRPFRRRYDDRRDDSASGGTPERRDDENGEK